MRRRRRRSNPGLIRRLGQWIVFVGRQVLRRPQAIILCALLALGAWTLWDYVHRAGAFRITSVALPADTALRLPQPLIGESIWAVDLPSLAETLHWQQPSLKAVRVTRQLPSTLRVDAIPRVPIAQVKIDRWYAVDRDGFILSEPDALSDGLVRLAVSERGGGLRVGRENASESLQLGLRVLDTVRHNPGAIARRVSEINVTDPQRIRLVLDGQTEVRCGTEAEFAAQMARLRATLSVVDRQSLAVQYIDVRFPEPVVSPRS